MPPFRHRLALPAGLYELHRLQAPAATQPDRVGHRPEHLCEWCRQSAGGTAVGRVTLAWQNRSITDFPPPQLSQTQRLLQDMREKMKAASDKVSARMAAAEQQVDELERTLVQLVQQRPPPTS